MWELSETTQLLPHLKTNFVTETFLLELQDWTVNLRQQVKCRGRKANMGVPAKTPAPVILEQKIRGGHKFFNKALKALLNLRTMSWRDWNNEAEVVEGMPRVYSLLWVFRALKGGLMVHVELLSCVSEQLASVGWLQTEKKGPKLWSHHTIKAAFLPLR